MRINGAYIVLILISLFLESHCQSFAEFDYCLFFVYFSEQEFISTNIYFGRVTTLYSRTEDSVQEYNSFGQGL